MNLLGAGGCAARGKPRQEKRKDAARVAFPGPSIIDRSRNRLKIS